MSSVSLTLAKSCLAQGAPTMLTATRKGMMASRGKLQSAALIASRRTFVSPRASPLVQAQPILYQSRGYASHSGRSDSNESQTHSSTRFDWSLNNGDRLVLAGMFSAFASFWARGIASRILLRFGGPVPMAIGAVTSLYEIGGWRLVLAVPGALAVAMAGKAAADAWHVEAFKAAVVRELHDAMGPSLPEDALEDLKAGDALEWETNRLRLLVHLPAKGSDSDSGTAWKFEANGFRHTSFNSWTVTSLSVSRGSPALRSASDYSPQTRYWDANDVSLRWQIIWQRDWDTFHEFVTCRPHIA